MERKAPRPRHAGTVAAPQRPAEAPRSGNWTRPEAIGASPAKATTAAAVLGSRAIWPSSALPTWAWSPPNTSSTTATSAAAPRSATTARARPRLVARGARLPPGGRPRAQGQLRHLGDEQRLGRLALEAGREQPLGEVGRPVVGVVLPLPLAPHVREAADLGGDDRVGAGLVEVAPRHPAPTLPGLHAAHHAVLALDPPLRRVGLGMPPDLLVVGGEHRVAIHPDNPTTAGPVMVGIPPRRTECG